MEDKKRLKNVWYCMKQRCYNPKHCAAPWYYEKGIRICDEWLDEFESFYEWSITHGYSQGLTIDRIDSDGNYEPSNCQWITQRENSRKAKRAKGPRGPYKKRVGGKGKFMVIDCDPDDWYFKLYLRRSHVVVEKTGLNFREAHQRVRELVHGFVTLRGRYSVAVNDGFEEGQTLHRSQVRYRLTDNIRR